MLENETIKDQLVQDSIVKACASVFPTDVWVIDPASQPKGVKSCRFVMATHPTDGRWAVLAWTSSRGAGTPELVVAGWVESIQRLDSQSIEVTLESGETVRSKPQASCACGSRLRSWAAWGPGVQLVAVPKPAVA